MLIEVLWSLHLCLAVPRFALRCVVWHLEVWRCGRPLTLLSASPLHSERLQCRLCACSPTCACVLLCLSCVLGIAFSLFVALDAIAHATASDCALVLDGVVVQGHVTASFKAGTEFASAKVSHAHLQSLKSGALCH